MSSQLVASIKPSQIPGSDPQSTKYLIVPLFIFFALLVFAMIRGPQIISSSGIGTAIMVSTPLILATYGLTALCLAGRVTVDLSIGPLIGFINVTTIQLYAAGYIQSPVAYFICALAIGVIYQFLYALIVLFIRVQPIIVALSMFLAFSGINLVILPRPGGRAPDWMLSWSAGTEIVQPVLILLIFSTLIHFIERDINPEYFGSILNSMWFGIATLTTVGYGDVTPSSPLGQVLTSLTMFLGIGMFALPAAILASAYYEEIQKRNFLITMETISSIPLFSMLPIGALSKINDKLVAEIYPAKRKIIEKGDEADCMYIIEFGSVQVEIESPVTLGQGDYFGEKGILSKEVRNASISSLEEVKLLSLSKEDLEELMEEYPHLFEELEKVSLDRTG